MNMLLGPKISISDKVMLPTGKLMSQSIKSIINNRKYKGSKVIASVPTLETLADLYDRSLPSSELTFDQYINGLQEKAVDNTNAANTYIEMNDGSMVSRPSGPAFNNCNGKWTEVGYAVFAWNALVKINRSAKECANGGQHNVFVYVKLPNRTSTDKDWIQLLDEAITTALIEYPASRNKKINPKSLNFGRPFELISSNPDAVILKFDSLTAGTLWKITKIKNFDPYTTIPCISAEIVGNLDSLFEKFKGTVLPSENLQCFLSVKRSLRPDRRYQWIHEGDHVKAILQWIEVSSVNPVVALDSELKYDDLNGKFFAVSLSKVSKDDHNAMDTGLAGSIVSPSLAPVWAVDKLFECLSFDKIEEQIKQMIAFK